MPLTITDNGNNATVTITWTGVKQVVHRKIEQAAEALFNDGAGNHGTPQNPRTFEDLSDAEINAIVNHELCFFGIKEKSKRLKGNKNAQAAYDAAAAEEDAEIINE